MDRAEAEAVYDAGRDVIARARRISPQHLSNISHGRERPSIETAQRIADALGRSRDSLSPQFTGIARP